MPTQRFLLAFAGAAATVAALSSGAANAQVVVYPAAPAVRVYGPPPARVYVGPAGAVRVGPACVTRTVRVWTGAGYAYRTVTRC
jgi:hypothetical protein